MAWVHLLLAIAFEIAGTTSMKLSNGFQNPWPTLAIFVCYGISIGFLTLAVRTIATREGSASHTASPTWPIFCTMVATAAPWPMSAASSGFAHAIGAGFNGI